MNNKSSQIMIVMIFFICSQAMGQDLKNDPTRWPLPDWETHDNSERMQTRECRNFKKFAINNEDFKTDALIVIKDGLVHFEYYDGVYGPDSPHVLWSVTKTITGALLGITERDGRINLDTELQDFYPLTSRDPNYEKITMKNLLYMDTGHMWDEDVKEVDQNPVVGMLYGIGHQDMATYAVTKKIIKEGPAYQWNYSTGIPTITMGVLKKIYGAEDFKMPWRNLFNPLGMKSVVFEKDLTGTFVGGSSGFATPRDLAKIGYLYLNDGIWNGEVLLPPEWIKKMLTPSPGYVSPGTVVKDVTKTGVYGGSIWLNKENIKTKGRPYPNVPEDMYMAIGFMGQFLIMIPSLKMIIVRNGHDLEFHSKLNEFIARTIQCVHDPEHVVTKSKSADGPMRMSLWKMIKNIRNSMQANTLQASIAKTVCSCHYVSGLDIPTCVKRNNFSLSKLVTKLTVRENKEKDGTMSIQVRLSKFARLFKLHFGNSAKAYYNPRQPEFGCTLK